MGVKYSQLPLADNVASDDYVAVLDSSESILKRTPVEHASTNTTFGVSTTSAYGHTKLVDDLNSATAVNGEALSARQGNVLGTDMGTAEEGDTASYAHAVGEWFMWKGQFVKVIAAIAAGNIIAYDVNVTATNVAAALTDVKNSIPDPVSVDGGGGSVFYVEADAEYEGYTVFIKKDGVTVASKVISNATAELTCTEIGTLSIEIAQLPSSEVAWSTTRTVTYYTKYTILAKGIVYGFKKQKSVSSPSARITYLESAEGMTPAYMNFTTDKFNYGDWENAFFMPRPCMLNYGGTVDYYLDPDDFTKKEDGSSSDIANSSYAGNVMIQFPKIYLKFVDDGTYEYTYISNYKVDDDYHCYSNYDINGNEIDYFYMPAYIGSNVSNRLRSISGLTPLNGAQGTTEIQYAEANNTSGKIWYIGQWCDRVTINSLLTLISKSTDSQTAFGTGFDTGGTGAGSLKASGYHNTKGMFYGKNDNSTPVKVFGIENYYGNIWQRCAGLMASGPAIYAKMTRSAVDGTTVSDYQTTAVTGYINTGKSMGGTSGGYISATYNHAKCGCLPVTASGSSSTYECDGLWFTNSSVLFALVGGACYNGARVGASCVALSGAVSFSGWDGGAALSCKPLAG